MLNVPFMPWQRMVADVGTEMLPDGRPAYREVVVTVPRQSGKTTLILAWEIHRALLWGGRQRIAYTAQTGQDARKKLTEDQYDDLIHRSPVREMVRQVKRSMADSAIIFKNGSRIDVLNTSQEAGHGKTLDLAVIDEAMAHEDERMEQALGPATVTRHEAQILIFSTAGTEKSVFLKRKVEAGRNAVNDGVNSGIAYFEWSADEGADMDDPEAWWGWMPALGHTIVEGVVESSRRGMSDGEFRRAFGNQWTVSDERVIPAEVWEAVVDPDAAPDAEVFAVEVTEDRAFATIAAADHQGRVEIVDHRPGTGWVLDACEKLSLEWHAEIVVDSYSPAGDFADKLEARGVPVHKYTSRTYAYACGEFYDKVADGLISARPHPALDAAVAGARKRTVGDAWAWARRDSDTVISPLVAATLALHRAAQDDTTEVQVMFV